MIIERIYEHEMFWMYVGFLVLVGACSFLALKDKKRRSKHVVKVSVGFLWVLSLAASVFIYLTIDRSYCGRNNSLCHGIAVDAFKFPPPCDETYDIKKDRGTCMILYNGLVEEVKEKEL